MKTPIKPNREACLQGWREASFKVNKSYVIADLTNVCEESQLYFLSLHSNHLNEILF